MHITFGGDSKHLGKDWNQICFKREGTLSLTCSLMYLYGSSMLSILITDSFLTSTPDPIGKNRNTGKGGNTINMASCNAHTGMMNDMLKVTEIRTLNTDFDLSGSEGVNPNFPDAYARVYISVLQQFVVEVD